MVILQYAWRTDANVHVDNDGDIVEGDGDDDVQGSPNSCDPARLKCQTPTNSLSYSQDSFRSDHHRHQNFIISCCVSIRQCILS